MASEIALRRSAPVRSATARWLGVLWLAGCSQLLGLEDGNTHGVCVDNEQCAPGYGCLLGECRSGCGADQECGDGSRCLKAIGTTACIPVSADCGDDMCPEGTSCVQGACRTGCGSTDDCAGGQECLGDVCVGTNETFEPAPTGDGGAGGKPATGGAAGAETMPPAAGADAGGMMSAGGTGAAGAAGQSSQAGQGGEAMGPVKPALNEPCDDIGELACNGAAGKLPLVCDDGTWKANGACNSSQNCDQQSGACEPILTPCVGKTPGFRSCGPNDLLRACGPDLVTLIDVETCEGNCNPAAGGASCDPPVCGDGKVQDNEDCEDENDVDTDDCTNACLDARCGDEIIQEGVEFCDDGNLNDTDECPNNCQQDVGEPVNQYGFAWKDSYFFVPCLQKQDYACITVTGACPNPSDPNPENRGAILAETFDIGGTPGTLYDVTIHVAGIVSARYYTGGTRRAGVNYPTDLATVMDGWHVGGDPQASNYDVFKITVLNLDGAEREHYFLNSFPQASGFESHKTFAIGYDATFVVEGGGTIQHRWQDANCHAIDNCNVGEVIGTACVQARTIPGEPNQVLPTSWHGQSLASMNITTGGAQPWHAQLVHITVTNVALHP